MVVVVPAAAVAAALKANALHQALPLLQNLQKLWPADSCNARRELIHTVHCAHMHSCVYLHTVSNVTAGKNTCSKCIAVLLASVRCHTSNQAENKSTQSKMTHLTVSTFVYL